MWLRDKTCGDVVKESWAEVHDPSLVSVLSNKIFTCQDNLRTWNRETFGHIWISLAKKLRELSGAEEAGLYRFNPTLIYTFREEIQVLKSKEETIKKQRSRVDWLREGDQNTRYFHCRANQRNKHNYILGLDDDYSNWVVDEGRMGGLVESYFTNIFTTSNCSGFDEVLNGVLPTVTEEINVGLFRTLQPKKFKRPFTRWILSQHLDLMSAFLSRHLITDNVLVAFKTLHYLKRKTQGLQGLLHKAEIEVLIRGVSICRNGPRVSYLFFVDDSVLFCRAKESECQVEQRNKALSILGACVEKITGVEGENSLSDWQGGTYQICYPSNSNLFYELLQTAKGLIKDIEVMICKFSWSYSGDSKKIHWVKWECLFEAKEDRGMGFKEIEKFNEALLAKQVWCMMNNLDSLCYKFFKVRFFPNCSILEANDLRVGSYAWKSILSAREEVKK
ncbi:uncharacterized protein LOC126690150 [Quercus robur]|uniref:uncharacterized protein LOC126690150 n=1 Tax=Quercus robur TaxID=38942 RepID=UPI0021624CA1|nr:uncharacterized protein LOC126690150 [Quercus robur]